MCGIAGVLLRPGVDPLLLAGVDRMLDLMRHRGPDAQGAVNLSGCPAESPRGRLGAVRLAIVDPGPEGDQPWVETDSGTVGALNGELYNHHEVRAALGALGWRSRCDTETLVRAWSRWGSVTPERLRGMFALAVWEPAKQILWLVRDRLGIKPLYHYEAPWGVAFASEARALVASGLVPRRIDSEGLKGYLHLGSVQEPLTLWAGVSAVPSGTCLRLRAGRIESVQRYWDASEAVKEPALADAADGVRHLFTDSVREHLLGDVPIACFMSGGIDSTLVAATARRERAGVLSAFTVGLDDTGGDEAAVARETARVLDIEYHEVRLPESAVLEAASRAVAAHDLPSADGVNTYLISQAVAESGFKVVLSGLGGDELFGGYPTFRRLRGIARWGGLLRRTPAIARRAAGGWGERGQRAIEATSHGSRLHLAYASLRGFWSARTISRMGLEPPFEPEEGATPADLPVGTRVSLLELNGYLRNTLLRDADTMSMAHSLELRVPFLDHRLVQHCLRVDAAGRTPPKALLRDTFRDVIPPHVTARPKRGFLVGMDGWLRGPLRRFAADGVAVAEASEYLSGLRSLRILDAFERRRITWPRLWQIAVLGHWLARWS